MRIRQLEAPLGALIEDIDLGAPLDGAAFDEIHRVWLDRSVVVFRDQQLTESALVQFSRRFGELEMPPASELRRRREGGGAAAAEIWIISNVKIEGESIGALGALEAEWHSDMSYLASPPSASILYAREIPQTGGNTSFACMHQAVAALPTALRAEIERLQIRHDSAYTSVGELRKGARAVDSLNDVEGAAHPAVRIHPESGRATLYPGRRLNASFVGLPRERSEALLDALWAVCTEPRFIYEHRWRPGDVVVWDNRSVIHRRDAFNNDDRRVMWRTQVKAPR
jgi:taurine dioxygenase